MATKETRSYQDRRKSLIDAVRRRRKKIRMMALNHKGGKCEICGYNRCQEALEFHHLTLNKKEFGISDRGYTRSWQKMLDEIEKCALLGSNCHREVHSGIKVFGKNDGDSP